MKLASAGPFLTLAVGFTLSAMLGTFAERDESSRDARRFEELSSALSSQITQHLAAHRDALIAARAHILESTVDRQSFTRYVDELDLGRRYRDFQGIGWTEVFPEEELASRVEQVRRERPAYHVWPDGPRPTYSAIVYLAPEDRRNRRAIGFDMYSEPTRRDAMNRAWHTGEAATTARVTLVQDSPQPAPGFLVYVPVYQSGSKRELRGFVYSPFNARMFFEGIRASAPARQLDLAVYDGEEEKNDSLLYRDDPAPSRDDRRTSRIDVGGRTWTLVFAPRASLRRTLVTRNATWAVAFGVVGTIALAAAVRRLAEARNRAEAELRAREEFLTLAAHELKTPLTPLRLQIQALRRALATHDDDKVIRRLDGLQRASERLTALVVTLLESGARESADVTVEEVDLAAVVRDVAARMEDAFAEAQSTITVDADEPVLGHWDRVRIEQVVVNLLSNAAKYGHNGPIEIAVRAEDARAVLIVRDHGIGIAPADRERVFEKFERAVSSRNYTGLGVGLWIVKRVVERARGTIRVEGTPGGGATFIVELPL